jgi:cytochrome P450
MASLAWLYNIARSQPKAIDKVFKRIRKQLKPETSNEIESQFHQLVRTAEEKLQLQQLLRNAEEKLQDMSVLFGIDPAPPHMLLCLAAFISIIFIGLIIRKIRNRARHRQLYGDNVFPPYAPCGVMETVSSLTGTKVPWFFKQCAEKVGPVFRLKVPFIKGTMFVAVGDLETAKEILQDPKTTKPEAHYASIASIGGGPNIVTSEGHNWKISRKGVAPAFVKEHLDRMHQVCKDRTEDWIQTKLEPSIDADESFDLSKELVHLTLSIICKAAFEYKIKKKEAETLVEEFDIVMREFAFNEVNNPLRNPFGIFLPSVRRARLARTRVHAIANIILQSYRKKPEHLRSQQDSIISCIDKNNNYKDDSHRIADIVMFLFAGHDTTAYSLSWTLLELARHPEETNRLRKALNGSDDLLAQQMLKDVLREGMRLRPVNPGVGVRTTGRDFYMKDKVIVIPKGSQVLFPSMVLTRHGVEDAEEFCPSRWRDHPDKSFLLFSTGRRNCVGQSLALAEITWVLSRLCAKYDFEVVDEGHPEFCVILKCVGARLKARRV